MVNMDHQGGVQILKMPVPGKSNQLTSASNVTLHITNPKRPTPAPMSSPENSLLQNRLPTLGSNTNIVTLTSLSGRFRQHTENNGSTSGEYKDLRVGLPQIKDACRTNDDVKKRRLPARAKSYMQTARTLAQDDQPKVFNPEPVPFHTQLFSDPLNKVRVVGRTLPTKIDNNLRSMGPVKRKLSINSFSNVVRNVSIPPRHGEMWGSPESPGETKRFILHTERYHQFDDDSDDTYQLSHRERMALEFAYADSQRSLRRQREVIPHRASMDFMMGGQRVELSERENVDVYQELKRLKSMVLPTVARDLYVGRGFKLPKKHALNNPRGSMVFESESTELSLSTMDNHKTYQTTPSAVLAVYKKTAHYRHSVQPGNKSKMAASSEKPPGGSTVIPAGANAADSRTKEATEGQRSKNGPEADDTKDKGKTATDQEKQISPTPDKLSSPKLLQGLNANDFLGTEEADAIRSQYQTLSGANERIEFDHFKSQLSGDLQPAQEEYMRKIFDVSRKNGELDEEAFISLHCLYKKISSLQGEPQEAFNGVDMSALDNNITKFGELFETVDRQQTGKITISSLHEVLKNALQADDMSAMLDTLTRIVDPNAEGFIHKLDYLAHVPYFLSLTP